MKNVKKDYVSALLHSGLFPNDKNRMWTMCQIVLKMATQVVEEAERLKMTNEQFYINFEDALNILSCKDHSGSQEQDKEFKDIVEKFNADSE